MPLHLSGSNPHCLGIPAEVLSLPHGSSPAINNNVLHFQKSINNEVTFKSGSTRTPRDVPRYCPQVSNAWVACKSLLCYVVSCCHSSQKDPDVYHPCSVGTSVSGPHNDHSSGRTNLRCVGESSKITGLDNSFNYTDLKLMGVPVFNKTCATITDMESSGEPAPPPASMNTEGNYSRKESYPELSGMNGSMSSAEIDGLIWQKLSELFSFHQIDELARCTSETVFLKKSNQMMELIDSLTQDYQLEKQDAECRLIQGIIRLSTRKERTNRNCTSGGDKGREQQFSRENGGKIPARSIIVTQESGSSSQGDLEVKISEETSFDIMARNLRRSADA
ncbi:keratinocyte differentiation factor 1 [Pelobates cultripes]|uniref:Keratinocyte differentiation factor 1 n=1 Tax=Pelobates cultripes TaxID=61616 RepID=A0AAD1R9X3_PELCU|nr:keratinocyte differentiation factor 1 [Pelobates cultripes]